MRNKYLVLVNKKSKIRDDWEDIIQLVKIKNVWAEDIKIEKETYKQYISLEKEIDDWLEFILSHTKELISAYEQKNDMNIEKRKEIKKKLLIEIYFPLF